MSIARYALLAAITLPTLASAQGLSGFNVFTSGDLTMQNSEVNGRVAVGGRLSMTNSSIGVSLPAGFTGYGLVADGTTASAWTNGQVFRGDAWFRTTPSLTGFGMPGGSVRTLAGGTAAPLDFASEVARLTTLNQSIAGLTATGTVAAVNGGSQLRFTGTNTGVNVFTVSAAQLAGATSGYQFFLGSGATALINVTGLGSGTTSLFSFGGFDFCTNANFTGCTQGDNNNPPSAVSRLLWNIWSASPTTVAFSGSMRGSVLAMNSTVQTTFGSCIGDLAARNLVGSCEWYDRPFTGELPPTQVVPEPATVLLLGTGLGVLAVARRRRRA